MKHTRMILSVAVVALAMPLTSLAQFKQAVIATQSFHMAGTVASEPSADATHSATQATSHSAAQMVRTSDEVSTPSAQQTSMSLAQQQSGQEQARGSSHLRSTRHAATSSTSNTQNQMTADASDSNNLMNSPIMPLITILQSGLTRVSQQQNLFQQQLRDKLEELTSENKELKDQVHALIQSVHQLIDRSKPHWQHKQRPKLTPQLRTHFVQSLWVRHWLLPQRYPILYTLFMGNATHCLAVLIDFLNGLQKS